MPPGVSLWFLIPTSFLGWIILLLITPVSVFVMKYWSNVWYTPMKLKRNHSYHLHPSLCFQNIYETSLMLYSTDALGFFQKSSIIPRRSGRGHRTCFPSPVPCHASRIRDQQIVKESCWNLVCYHPALITGSLFTFSTIDQIRSFGVGGWIAWKGTGGVRNCLLPWRRSPATASCAARDSWTLISLSIPAVSTS